MKDVIQAIGQASRIQTECNKRARIISGKISAIERKQLKTKNIKQRIKLSNDKTWLEIEQERLINRGMKVWYSVTDFKGKYIQWKNNHLVNGKWYSGTIELIQEAHKLNPVFNQ